MIEVARKCTKCGEEFPATEEYFYKVAKGKHSLSSWCKPCHKKHSYENVKAWRKSNPGQYKSQLLKYKYQLTIEEYEDVLQEQNGVCAICGHPETECQPNGDIKFLAVDHNHETGQIRGLLCHNCNRLLGFAYEDKEVLLSAIKYLEKWNA